MGENVFPDSVDVNVISPLETSSKGAVGVPVFVQDQTSPILTTPFLKTINTAVLANDTVADTYVIGVDVGHGAVAGNILELATAAGDDFMQSAVVSSTATTITLLEAINTVYLVGSTTVIISSADMNIDGSTTRQIFSIAPLPAQTGNIARIIIEIRDSSAMDFTTLGGLAALANGCSLRINRGDGTFSNLFGFKDNGDIINQAFDYSFLEANGGGGRAFISRVTWGGASKHGAVIQLNGSLGEELQLLINDDLTGLDRFKIIAQGHIVQD